LPQPASEVPAPSEGMTVGAVPIGAALTDPAQGPHSERVLPGTL